MCGGRLAAGRVARGYRSAVRRLTLASMAILPPHAANRHDAGCGGAGRDCDNQINGCASNCRASQELTPPIIQVLQPAAARPVGMRHGGADRINGQRPEAIVAET